jgi:hypothetical protein
LFNKGATMANKRIINGHVWEDEFFLTLTIFERLLWIGVLTAAADDQGRLMDNAAMIRSKVFPVDDISLAEVESAMQKFAQAGKIVRYERQGKRAIQIVNWWKHQTPRWAGESTLPAPKQWTDRWRYHGPGGSQGGTIKTQNWEKAGGFDENYIARNTMPYINDDVNDDINDDVDDKRAAEEKGDTYLLSDEFATMTGIMPYNNEQWAKSIQAMVLNGVDAEILKTAYWQLTKGMEQQNKKPFTISGPWSLEKNAISMAAEKRKASTNKMYEGSILLTDGTITEA